jgi:FixJ family two-component response regulator
MIKLDPTELNEFIIEANELLETAEQELLLAENGKSTLFYDATFRALHSIKGGAGMLGLSELQDHMHKIENHWINIKSKLSIEKNELEYFLASIDGARKLILGEKISFDYTGPIAGTQSNLNQKINIRKNTEIIKTPTKGLIFAIDDEEDILSILQDILCEDGFEVTCYNNADELFAALTKTIPDLILTDFNMPKITGLEVLQYVKKVNPDIPVILLSGYLSKNMLVQSMQIGGFYSVLEKPFNPTDLLRECWSANRHHKLKKMMRRSLHLLIYQFSDLEQFLISQGKADIVKTIANELKLLLSEHK